MQSISRTRLLLLLLTTVVAACEQSVEPIDIPYVERLVVRGELWPGEPITGIRVSRTLPINEPDTPDSWEKAAIDSAVVTVQSAAGTFRLRHEGFGRYGDTALIAQSGETYTLMVEWQGKRVTATTTVPFATPIDSVAFIPKSYDYGFVDSVLEVTFTPQGDQVYAVTEAQLLESQFPDDSIPFYHLSEDGLWNSERIARRRDTSEDGRIRLRTQYGSGFSPDGTDTIYAVLSIFDPQFYDFYQTYNRSNDFDGPFSTGGETVAWNVTGDGIGMFIGRARSERRVRP